MTFQVKFRKNRSYVKTVIFNYLLTLIGFSIVKTGEEINPIIMLLVGWVACYIFGWVVAKNLVKKDLALSIENPWVVVRALGLAFLITYIITHSFFSSYYKLVDEWSLNEVLASVNVQPFLSWFLGGFYLSKRAYTSIIPMKRVPRSYRYVYPRKTRIASGKYCHKCGMYNPLEYGFCRNCGANLSDKSTNQKHYLVVDFKEAVRQLDSEKTPRGQRMDIQFECVVYSPASSERSGGSAPYRTIRVSDPNREITRTLHVWGDYGHRHNFDLVGSLQKGDRILVMGPRRPKDSKYYKDEWGRDVFWIERWDGTENDNGTRMYKIEEKEVVTFEKDSRSFSTPPFYCQLCAEKHPAGTVALQCTNCGRFICEKSYKEMVEAGRNKCPMCDGKLDYL
ncbi:MAG: hypothetical protein ACTSW1_13765 [Candidatus Hodarchaeales archaeon]